MKTNSKLYVYHSGLFLEDNINPGTYVPECSWNTEVISMADIKITRFIDLCNHYGYKPEVIMKLDKIA